MKRVKINPQQIALVYKNAEFKRVVPTGNQWLRLKENVVIYTKNKVYNSTDDIELLESNAAFAEATQQIHVKDNEIALVFFRKNFLNILTSGNYFYFKGDSEIIINQYNLNSAEQIGDIDRSILKNSALGNFVKTFRIETFEKGLLFQDGKLICELECGTYYFWNGAKSIEVQKVDIRITQMEISGQELLTKDKATLRINFQLEYKVLDCQKALLENRDFYKQLYVKAQFALREFIGKLTLDELLDSKEKVGEFVLLQLKKTAIWLGLEVFNAGIKDIILPGDVKEIMNQVLIAEKQAQANVIARREETASARTMLNTAKLMEENSVLYKLKEMEHLEKVANKIGEINVSGTGSVIEQLSKILVK